MLDGQPAAGPGGARASPTGPVPFGRREQGHRGKRPVRAGDRSFAERTGRGTPDSQAKIDKLIEDISAYERDNGLNLADPPAVAPQPSFPADPPSPFPGPAPSPFPGAGATSFPAGGATFFPAADDAAPSQMPTFFQSPEEPGTPQSGGPGGFPPES